MSRFEETGRHKTFSSPRVGIMLYDLRFIVASDDITDLVGINRNHDTIPVGIVTVLPYPINQTLPLRGSKPLGVDIEADKSPVLIRVDDFQEWRDDRQKSEAEMPPEVHRQFTAAFKMNARMFEIHFEIIPAGLTALSQHRRRRA
jgi:hypothetical protein